MTQRNTKDHTKEDGKGREAGVIKIEDQGGLAKEFITIGRSFEEALGRCTIRDEEQKNAIIIYKAQLDIFDMDEEVQDLTNWLNASAAVGGFNRSLASMTETRIYVPEGAGIHMDKGTQKTLIEMQKLRGAAKQSTPEQEEHKD